MTELFTSSMSSRDEDKVSGVTTEQQWKGMRVLYSHRLYCGAARRHG